MITIKIAKQKISWYNISYDINYDDMLRSRKIWWSRKVKSQLRRVLLGRKYSDTIYGMTYLASVYHVQQKYYEVEEINLTIFQLRRKMQDGKNSNRLRVIAWQISPRHSIGNQSSKVETLYLEVSQLWREMLAKNRFDIINSIRE